MNTTYGESLKDRFGERVERDGRELETVRVSQHWWSRPKTMIKYTIDGQVRTGIPAERTEIELTLNPCELQGIDSMTKIIGTPVTVGKRVKQ